MRLNGAKVGQLAAERGWTISELLDRAGVSRTAYYSLARKDSALPRSVVALAETLDVPASSLLDESGSEEARVRRRLALAERIASRHAGSSFENIWHTLVLLEASPLERLNAALRRGRPRSLQRA